MSGRGDLGVEVINTGTELLLGQVVNTHVAWFGERLFELGLRIARQVAIPDGMVIGHALEEAFERAEIVLVTGGLGPTEDDVTREVVAEMFGLDLERDDRIVADIDERFSRIGRKPESNNLRQAMVPRGAKVLRNANGTAPGLYFPAGLSGNSPHLFLLPGPPRELKPMFDGQVATIIREFLPGEASQCRNYWYFGIGESRLAARADKALAGIEGLELGYCLKESGVIVRCIGSAEELEKADAAIREVYPQSLVSDDGRTMEEVVVGLLGEKKACLATAESCTGGFIAHHVTNVSGASEVFKRGYVTYANSAKAELLGVSGQDLEAHGAVSEPVASQMASGCLGVSGADHAIAVTGIAGPTGGTEEKPVGTVFVGLASVGAEPVVKHFRFQTDRLTFKERVTRTALDLVRRRLLGII